MCSRVYLGRKERFVFSDNFLSMLNIFLNTIDEMEYQVMCRRCPAMTEQIFLVI